MAGDRCSLVWSKDAEDDLLSIWHYGVREWSATAAEEYERALWRTCHRLIENAHLGRPRDELIRGLRSILADPYVVFYRISPTSIEIVRVLHEREDTDAIFH